MQASQSHIGAFWTQGVINDHNDIHSTHEAHTVKTFPSTNMFPPSAVSVHGSSFNIQKRSLTLAEAQQIFEAEKYTTALKFLAELDRVVTNGKLSAIAKSFGGIEVVWSQTLKSAAGRTRYSKTPGTFDTAMPIPIRKAAIDLASSIIDNEDKLLNTLAHEFCHLANLMISNVRNQPHGKSFKEWGAKVSSMFKHKNIHVTTNHSYTIDWKYIWACTLCPVKYQHHTRRIDPSRQLCRNCSGKLIQIKPVPGDISDPCDIKAARIIPYREYVEKWYLSTKQEKPGCKEEEIMIELAKRYDIEQKNHNASHKQGGKEELGSLETKEIAAIVISYDDESESDMEDADGYISCLVFD